MYICVYIYIYIYIYTARPKGRRQSYPEAGALRPVALRQGSRRRLARRTNRERAARRDFRKGTNGVSTDGVTAILMLFDGGTFGVLLLT